MAIYPSIMLKRFRFSPKITTICVLIAGVMLWCSNWQWNRYLAKSELVETYAENYSAEPLPFPPKLNGEDPYESVTHRRVRLSGTYDYERELIVTNRKHASGPGHWLLTPLKLEGSDRYVMVSRGFIPFADRQLDSWGQYRGPDQETLDGVVQPAKKKKFLGPSNPTVGPNEPYQTIWYYPEISKMAIQLPYPVIEEVFVQRIGGLPDKEFPAQSISIAVPPQTHFGYTIEWILLALATLGIGFLLQAFPRKRAAAAALALLLPLSATHTAKAVEDPGELKEKIGIEEHLDQIIDLELTLTNRFGEPVVLGELIPENRPAIFVPVYYSCPRLCGLTLGGISDLINALDLALGDEYVVITFTIDPSESSELAMKKSDEFFARLDEPEAGLRGWSFLTGSNSAVSKLATQLGFLYQEDRGEFAHTAAFMIITPDGRISRYFYGVEYKPRDVRFALVEAAKGRIGSTIDKVLLYCFRYDHLTGQYSLLIWNIVRVICIGFAIIVLTTLAVWWAREVRTRRKDA